MLELNIFDTVLPMKVVPVGESFLYVGVYIGELISSNLSVVFPNDWRATLKGVGISGFVVTLALVLVVREPARRREYLQLTTTSSSESKQGKSFNDGDEFVGKAIVPDTGSVVQARHFSLLGGRQGEFMASLVRIVRMLSLILK